MIFIIHLNKQIHYACGASVIVVKRVLEVEISLPFQDSREDVIETKGTV